jgi:hypothetical protein
MQTQRILKQTARSTVEGKRKRGSRRRRWKEEAEEDLNIMAINETSQQSSRDLREWRDNLI